MKKISADELEKLEAIKNNVTDLVKAHVYPEGHLTKEDIQYLKDYGVTVDFNDINDNDSAYHLREILLGKDVEKPEED